MKEALWYRKLSRTLFISLALVAWPLASSARATADIVPNAPPALDELRDALFDAWSAAKHKEWEPARVSARTSAHAWGQLRDGPSGRTFPATLIWRLDALEGALTHAIEKHDARRLAKLANHGLRLTLAIRRHFRAEPGLMYEKLRLDLRDLLEAANHGSFRAAEWARKRTLFSFEALREPVARHASMQTGRMRDLPLYYAICFDEIQASVRYRHRERLVRAVGSLLDLVDTTEGATLRAEP